MIKPGEVQNKARELKVRDQQIEKDYVLTWILQGIAQHKQLANSIVFKGGTVLKKVYFEDYRFSEDLDFTLLDDTIYNEQIFEWFRETFKYVQEEANIPLEIIDDNEHQDGGINFHISYIGPLGGEGRNKKVKIDISRNEKLIFEAITLGLIISYTDQKPHQLLCYPLEEILVEKLRSIIQRMQPRDLYDIWYIVQIHGIDIGLYRHEFRAKCQIKGINPVIFHEKLNQRLPQYKGRWQKSMADQVHDLPNFEQVERELMRHMKKFTL